MNHIMTSLNELLRLAALGDVQAANKLRGALQDRLELLVRRRLRTEVGRCELARWLGLSDPCQFDRTEAESLAEQLFELLVERRAAPWRRTIRTGQFEMETIEA